MLSPVILPVIFTLKMLSILLHVLYVCIPTAYVAIFGGANAQRFLPHQQFPVGPRGGWFGGYGGGGVPPPPGAGGGLYFPQSSPYGNWFTQQQLLQPQPQLQQPLPPQLQQQQLPTGTFYTGWPQAQHNAFVDSNKRLYQTFPNYGQQQLLQLQYSQPPFNAAQQQQDFYNNKYGPQAALLQSVLQRQEWHQQPVSVLDGGGNSALRQQQQLPVYLLPSSDLVINPSFSSQQHHQPYAALLLSLNSFYPSHLSPGISLGRVNELPSPASGSGGFAQPTSFLPFNEQPGSIDSMPAPTNFAGSSPISQTNMIPPTSGFYKTQPLNTPPSTTGPETSPLAGFAPPAAPNGVVQPTTQPTQQEEQQQQPPPTPDAQQQQPEQLQPPVQEATRDTTDMSNNNAVGAATDAPPNQPLEQLAETPSPTPPEEFTETTTIAVVEFYAPSSPPQNIEEEQHHDTNSDSPAPLSVSYHDTPQALTAPLPPPSPPAVFDSPKCPQVGPDHHEYCYYTHARTLPAALAHCHDEGMQLARMTAANADYLNYLIDKTFVGGATNSSTCLDKLTLLGNYDVSMKVGSYAYTLGDRCQRNLANAFTNVTVTNTTAVDADADFPPSQYNICLRFEDCTLVDWLTPRPYFCVRLQNTVGTAAATVDGNSSSSSSDQQFLPLRYFTSVGQWDYFVTTDTVNKQLEEAKSYSVQSSTSLAPAFVPLEPTCIPPKYGETPAKVLDVLKSEAQMPKTFSLITQSFKGSEFRRKCFPNCTDAEALANAYVVCVKDSTLQSFATGKCAMLNIPTKYTTAPPTKTPSFFKKNLSVPKNTDASTTPTSPRAAPKLEQLWPGGTVPYNFSTGFTTEQKDKLIMAMNSIDSVSCIRFVPLNESVVGSDAGSTSFIQFQHFSGPNFCQTQEYGRGRVGGGAHDIAFANECFSEQAQLLAQLLYVLGLTPENNRFDRSQYVRIAYDNIKQQQQTIRKFQQQLLPTLITQRVPYDYASLTHWPASASAKQKGLHTIEALVGAGHEQQKAKFGQRERLSPGDIAKLDVLYGMECVERLKDARHR